MSFSASRPPFGWLIGVISRATTPTVAFWAVMALTARVIRWLRGDGAEAPRARMATV